MIYDFSVHPLEFEATITPDETSEYGFSVAEDDYEITIYGDCPNYFLTIEVDEIKESNVLGEPLFVASEAYLFASGDKDKLTSIAASAEVNVNADWNATTGDALILNKPVVPTLLSQLTQTSAYRTVTDTEKSTWNSKADGNHNHALLYEPLGKVVLHESSYEHTHTTRGTYLYHAQVKASDTAGDWRQYAGASGFYTQYCTVGNATKGGGTWVTKFTIEL